MKPFIPEMIFFDYGGTLLDEGRFDEVAAARAILSCADNPRAASEETVLALWREANALIGRRTHADAIGLEIPLTPTLRGVMARAGLKTSLSPLEIEIAFHRQNAFHKPMPFVSEMLSVLREKNVRTAVISNITLSGDALWLAISDCIPNHSFEFVITSADYVFCKPSPLLFDAALKKAGEAPERCWYCGNDFNADVVGAVSSGMFPVFFDQSSKTESAMERFELGDYLRVNSWRALAALIEQL